MISILEGGCWKKGGDFFQGSCSFYIKNKLKNEIFNKKKKWNKFFFSVSANNLIWEVIAKNFVTFK